MPAGGERWRGRTGELFAYIVVVLLTFLYFLHRFHADFGPLHPFWDARVYARALQEWRGGLNPYAVAGPGAGVVLPFVSPPVFLYLLDVASKVVPGHAGFRVYCVLASGCAVAVPTLLAMFYLRSRWMTPALALFLAWFLPGKHGSQALLTGNVSNVLYAALLAAGVPGLRRDRWAPFYVALVVASLLKPPFLAFLLLPLLAGRRQWLPSLGAGLAVLTGDLIQKMAAPHFWDSFERAVRLRVFLRGDAGFGLLGQLSALRAHLGVLRGPSPSAEDVLVVAPLLVLVVLLRGRRFGPAGRLWVPCLVDLAALCNPRILDYDANVAIVPAVFIAMEFFLNLPRGPYRGLQAGVAATLFLGLEAVDPDAALCVLLVGSVVMVICLLVWPARFQSGWSEQGGRFGEAQGAVG